MNSVDRTMLCMPLRDSDNTIIGVVTLINKRFGCFTNNDEDFVEAFGVFAGHSLENVSKLDQVKQAEARCQVTLDIMAYHASSSVAEAEKLSELVTPSSLQLRLMTFSFTDQEMEDIDTLKASLRMFKDLGLVRKFKLEHKTLCRWLLTVKKNYRPEVAYHNWRHAFQVAQVDHCCQVQGVSKKKALLGFLLQQGGSGLLQRARYQSKTLSNIFF